MIFFWSKRPPSFKVRIESSGRTNDPFIGVLRKPWLGRYLCFCLVSVYNLAKCSRAQETLGWAVMDGVGIAFHSWESSDLVNTCSGLKKLLRILAPLA